MGNGIRTLVEMRRRIWPSSAVELVASEHGAIEVAETASFIGRWLAVSWISEDFDRSDQFPPGPYAEIASGLLTAVPELQMWLECDNSLMRFRTEIGTEEREAIAKEYLDIEKPELFFKRPRV